MRLNIVHAIEVTNSVEAPRPLLAWGTPAIIWNILNPPLCADMASTDPDLILPQGMTLEEVIASIRDEDMEQFRKDRDLRESIFQEAEQYLRLPAERWPSLTFNWDLSQEGQRFALGGCRRLISRFNTRQASALDGLTSQSSTQNFATTAAAIPLRNSGTSVLSFD